MLMADFQRNFSKQSCNIPRICGITSWTSSTDEVQRQLSHTMAKSLSKGKNTLFFPNDLKYTENENTNLLQEINLIIHKL